MPRLIHARMPLMSMLLASSLMATACTGTTTVRLEDPTDSVLQVRDVTYVFPTQLSLHQSATESLPVEMWIPLPNEVLAELQKPEFKDKVFREGRQIEYRNRGGSQHPFIHVWGSIRVPVVPKSDVSVLYADKLSIPSDKVVAMLHDGSVIKISVIDADGRSILSLFVGPKQKESTPSVQRAAE